MKALTFRYDTAGCEKSTADFLSFVRKTTPRFCGTSSYRTRAFFYSESTFILVVKTVHNQSNAV